MDVEAPSPYGYGKGLVTAVQDKRLSEDELDTSVRLVLRDKFALGVFSSRPIVSVPSVPS